MTKILKKAEEAYNAGEETGLADAQYDALMAKMGVKKGASAEVLRNKVAHVNHMGSLETFYTEAEVARFTKDWDVGAGVYVMPKLDGISVEIAYANGYLKHIVTRGDGDVGEDLTENLRGLVPELSERTETYARRAEVVMSNEKFAEYPGKTESSNPRNICAGMVRRSGSADDCKKWLHVVVFNPGTHRAGTLCEGLEGINEMRNMLICPMAVDVPLETAIADPWKWLPHDLLSFPTDGIVIANRADMTDEGWITSQSSKCPKNAFAFKFKGASVTTKVRAIVADVGSMGALTPVAELEPVSVGGVMVSRVTLHNYDFMAVHDIRVGSVIELERAGEVIPYVLGVTDNSGAAEAPYGVPDTCPCCGSKAEYKVNKGGDESVHVYCSDDNCRGRQASRMRRYFKTIGVLGVGDEMCETAVRVVEALGVDPIRALYYSPELREKIIPSAKVREKIVKQLSAPISMAVFLDAVGIPGIGTTAGKELGHLSSVRDLLNFKDCENKWVTPAVREYVKNAYVRLTLLEGAVMPVPEAPKAKGGDKIGIAITGTLDQPRAHYEALINASEAYEFSDGIRKNTRFLLAADANGTSSKLEAARKKGVEVINTTKLKELLEI